jgi:hypothetical protein
VYGKNIFTLAVILTIITGCTAAPSKPLEISSTPVFTYIPSPIVTPNLDLATPLPSPALPNFSATKIRMPSDTDRREVMTAFWTQNGSIIYYALANGIQDKLLWFEIELVNGKVTQDNQLSPPPNINYTPNLPGGIYYEYQGLVSPDERYRFQITEGNKFSLYLLDNKDQSKVELLVTPDMNFRGAYWMLNENSVVFGIGPEYGTYLYFYNIRERKLQSFEKLIGYSDPNISEWVLSPDGKYVAILDGNQKLKLFSLDGDFSITLPNHSSNVRWAGDSKKIYYYSGMQFYTPTIIGYYDIAKKTVVDLIPLSKLEKSGVDTNGFFDVSLNGTQLTYWQGGDIWLVTFH